MLTLSNLAVALNHLGDYERFDEIINLIEKNITKNNIGYGYYFDTYYYDSNLSHLSQFTENLFDLKIIHAQ